MEVRELLQMIRHTRPWVLLIFLIIAFQSLQNAMPPETPQVQMLASR
jgi:F0F1-type ATP synthase assembly protein I